MRYEIKGFISDTHADVLDVTETGEKQPSYVSGSRTVTVHSGMGTIELPWDAHPMLKVGHPVRLIVEVSE